MEKERLRLVGLAKYKKRQLQHSRYNDTIATKATRKLKEMDPVGAEDGEEGEEEEEEKETRESKEGKEGKEEKKETTDKEEKEGTVVEGKETPVAAMPAGRQRDLCERISAQLLVVLRRLLSPTGATTGGAGPTHVVSYHPDASMCVLFLTELVESIETTTGKAD